jgi:hypothetical protein
MARFITILTVAVGILFSFYVCHTKKVKSPYSRESAEEDIEAGNVMIYSLGLSILDRIPAEKLDCLQIKYGFKDNNLGCFANDGLENAIKEYNDVVKKYLAKRNGVDWEKRYYNDVFKMAGLKRGAAP